MISASRATMTGPASNRINFVFLINLSRHTYHTENMKEQAFALRKGIEFLHYGITYLELFPLLYVTKLRIFLPALHVSVPWPC